jgi:aryl-alcohol dehydrogenase-like predicted oxidoreductase
MPNLLGSTEVYDPKNAYETVPLEEQLRAIDELVRAGKVRHMGVSNESPWGVMEFSRHNILKSPLHSDFV